MMGSLGSQSVSVSGITKDKTMARSIGIIKIKKLKALVAECMEKPFYSFESIINKVPYEYYDTWEDAQSEVNRIVWDTMNKINATK